jgi:hypothetical protein
MGGKEKDRMIELLISACLVGGQDCRDISMLYDARDVSLIACITTGQTEVARWQVNHPNYRIARYSCRVAGQGKEI